MTEISKKNSFTATRELPPIPPPGDPIFVEVVRGNAVESLHVVHAVLTDHAGKILGVWGEESFLVFPRSSIKALQAAAFVSLGVHENLKLSAKELAIACASHNGEKIHEKIVVDWLEKIGLQESDLECGTHAPYDLPSYDNLVHEGRKPCRIHNNCSGKHVGMLSGILAQKQKTKNYSHYDHPYQKRIRNILEEFMGLSLENAPWGIDGCGIPTIAVPLKNMSLAMAHFAHSQLLSAELNCASAVLREAIREEPYMIGGRGSVCTEIIQATKGEALVKVGAEGVYGAAFPRLGLGLAMKAEDGNSRAVEVVLANFVKKLALNFFSEEKSLDQHCVPILRNWDKEIIGEIRLAK